MNVHRLTLPYDRPVLQMADNKAAAGSDALVVEAVVGTVRGYADGALNVCQFWYPTALCRDGGSLIVVDCQNHLIRAVEGVLEVVHPLTESKAAGGSFAEFEARAVPLLMTAIPVLPKELAQLIALYTRSNASTRTIAGTPHSRGAADGPALSAAQFTAPLSIALDTTDPVAGPHDHR